MNKVFSMLGEAIKKLSAMVQVNQKASAAEVLLIELLGEVCQLQFERQNEAFSGVLLGASDNDTEWFCGASFKAHWLTAIEVHDDGSYTICVRIPDDEYAEMLADFEEEQGEISFFRG